MTGNPSKRPLPEGEPEPSGPLGPAPPYLLEPERLAWEEIRQAGHLWLTDADSIPVEMLSRLLFESRANFHGMKAVRIGLIVRLCSMLGFSPADRARMSMPKGAEEEDPADKYFATP